MIVCAAVKLHIDKTGEEVVLCGPRHHYAYDQLLKLGFEPQKGYKFVVDGFVDHMGNFMNREDALKYAIKIGQVCSEIRGKYWKGTKKELYSEDLW